MNKFTCILFCFLLANTVTAQYEFKLLDSIPEQVRWIETDAMQHLYLVEDEHSLSKYDSRGQLLYQFNVNDLGSITAINVQNPFYILVYYNDYNTLVILDRTLSEVRRQDLTDLGIDQIQAIGMASDNNIWIFDNATYTLQKIDAQNEVLLESIDLSLDISVDLSPIRLIEYNNEIYMHSPDVGILVFDQYANYQKTIRVGEINFFQLYEGQLFFMQKDSLCRYHLRSFQTQVIDLEFDMSGVLQVAIAQNRLYMRRKEQIMVVEILKKEED